MCALFLPLFSSFFIVIGPIVCCLCVSVHAPVYFVCLESKAFRFFFHSEIASDTSAKSGSNYRFIIAHIAYDIGFWKFVNYCLECEGSCISVIKLKMCLMRKSCQISNVVYFERILIAPSFKLKKKKMNPDINSFWQISFLVLVYVYTNTLRTHDHISISQL